MIFYVSIVGTIFTGLADGRVIGFKDKEYWEVTRFGDNLPGCGNEFIYVLVV